MLHAAVLGVGLGLLLRPAAGAAFDGGTDGQQKPDPKTAARMRVSALYIM